MFFVLAEHLDNVPVGRRVRQLEYISSRRQRLARNLNRTAEAEDGPLIPLGRPRRAGPSHPQMHDQRRELLSHLFRSFVLWRLFHETK